MNIMSNLLENTLGNDAFILVNKKMVKLVGLEASVLLGDLIGKRKYFRDRDELHYGAFFITRDKIEENLGLTPHQQRKAEDKLVEAGMLKIESKSQMVNGKPICKKVNYYTIVDEICLSALSKDINSRTSKSLICVDEKIECAYVKEFNGKETQVKKTQVKKTQIKKNRGNDGDGGDGGTMGDTSLHPNPQISHSLQLAGVSSIDEYWDNI